MLEILLFILCSTSQKYPLFLFYSDDTLLLPIILKLFHILLLQVAMILY